MASRVQVLRQFMVGVAFRAGDEVLVWNLSVQGRWCSDDGDKCQGSILRAVSAQGFASGSFFLSSQTALKSKFALACTRWNAIRTRKPRA